MERSNPSSPTQSHSKSQPKVQTTFRLHIKSQHHITAPPRKVSKVNHGQKIRALAIHISHAIHPSPISHNTNASCRAKSSSLNSNPFSFLSLFFRDQDEYRSVVGEMIRNQRASRLDSDAGLSPMPPLGVVSVMGLAVVRAPADAGCRVFSLLPVHHRRIPFPSFHSLPFPSFWEVGSGGGDLDGWWGELRFVTGEVCIYLIVFPVRRRIH